MAKVAEKFNFPFSLYSSILNTIKKDKLKDILTDNKIPCAKGRRYFYNQREINNR